MMDEASARICRQHYSSRLHMVFLPRYKATDGVPATHVCMCNGRYALPPDAAARLPALLAAEFRDGNREYLCEVVGTPFRFFIDLDLPPVPEADRAALTADVAQCCADLGVVADGARIVCVACHTDTKTGYHVHVPGFVTDAPTARWVLEAMTTLTVASWREHLDPSPFTGSLRMLYCSKADRTTPQVKRHVGREYEVESVYTVRAVGDDAWTVAPDPDETARLRADPEAAIRACAVRVDDAGWPRPPTPHPPARVARRAAMGVVDLTAVARALGFPKEFAMAAESWKTKGDAVVVQTTSRYCPRKGGEHKTRRLALRLTTTSARLLCDDGECMRANGGRRTVGWAALPGEEVEVWVTSVLGDGVH